jgi:hypothetical protein
VAMSLFVINILLTIVYSRFLRSEVSY